MNRIWPHFIYLPVNIEKCNFNSLEDFFRVAQEQDQIVAVNIGRPHKSNPILKSMFQNGLNIPVNIDALVKDYRNGSLVPHNLNAHSFIKWFKENVGSPEGKAVLLIGVGGAGEAIARAIIATRPQKLILIDPFSKQQLQDELRKEGNVDYYSQLKEITSMRRAKNLIVINAAGKEAAADPNLSQLLQLNKTRDNVFIDLRPQLAVDTVKQAKRLGWNSFSGFGMNVINDYTLLREISRQTNQTLLSFLRFETLVLAASSVL
jgi:shikimate 5-dehydrogenase